MIGGSRAVAAPRTAAAGTRLRRLGRPALVLGGLGLALLATAILAIGLGEEYVPPREVLGIALQWLPVHPARTWSDVDLTIITLVRLPRILTAMLVGGSLAVAGAAFQALFRNPLADPGIVGTSAGASMGAVLALTLPVQVVWLGFSFVSVAAFACALGTMLLVYGLARVGGRLPSTTLLLAGFAVSATFNAIAALIEALSDRLREMYTWLLGSLANATIDQLAVACPLLALGTGGLILLSRDLNVLLLGDEQAHYLGLHVTQRRLLILALGSLLTGVAVALSGLIAFVGLLVPHIARLLFGANHRLLLPASLLLGAIFLLLVDTVARLVLAPQELPIGLITALIGAPWFLVLLRRKKGEYLF
jgi:iron complex transport system permease protein